MIALQRYPAVIVRDHAARLGIVVVIQLGRQDHRLSLGLPLTWHGVAPVTP
jgi:hypothetical protein